MAICQIMIADYLHGWGGYGCGYEDDDLLNGIDYCQDLKEQYGFTCEPHHGYNLLHFIAWAKKRMR